MLLYYVAAFNFGDSIEKSDAVLTVLDNKTEDSKRWLNFGGDCREKLGVLIYVLKSLSELRFLSQTCAVLAVHLKKVSEIVRVIS